jgi:WD40-like Beta Propeller Repeat
MAFDAACAAAGIQVIRTPIRAPRANAHAARGYAPAPHLAPRPETVGRSRVYQRSPGSERREEPMSSRATPMLWMAAAATVVLAGCTSGGDAQSGSVAGTPPPSTGLSAGSSANSEPSPAASGPIDVSSLTGRITFSNGTEDIWVVNADRSGLDRLTTNPAHDFDPAWSPDGRTVAFRSERDGNRPLSK